MKGDWKEQATELERMFHCQVRDWRYTLRGMMLHLET